MEVEPKSRGITASWRFSVFLNVVLICALGTAVAAGIVFVVRKVSFSTDLRYDLTRDSRYALDDTSKNILRALEAPVSVDFVYGIDADIGMRALDVYNRPRQPIIDAYYTPLLREIAGRVDTLVNEWKNASRLVSSRSIYADQNPQAVEALAREMGREPGELVNKVFISMGRRRREVPIRRLADISWGFFPAVQNRPNEPPVLRGHWRVQSELTAALRSVSVGEDAPVGVVVGSDSRFEPGSDLFAVPDQVLKGEGYALEPLDLKNVEAVPDHLRAVLLLGLKGCLDAGQLGKLRGYEERGGRIFVLADPQFPESYGQMLAPYGTALENAVIEDPDHGDPRRGSDREIDSRSLCVGRHDIDRPLQMRIPIYLGACRPIASMPDRAPGAERVTLLRGSPSAQRLEVEYDGQTGIARIFEGTKKVMTSPSLAVALRRPAAQGGSREARLVVFGGSGLLMPQELSLATHWGNRDLLLNSLNWLTDREAQIGITEHEDIPARIDAFPPAESAILWVGIVGLPSLSIILGLAVYLTRRS